MQFISKFRKPLICLATAMAFGPAMSYSECQGNISTIWTGDGGNIQVVFTNGASFLIGPTDPNSKNILPMVAIALVAQKPIIVRYSSNTVSCTATGARTDVLGIWTLN